ncbi:unnamed protein product [Durusdinium trenchii]|uniref:Uncharacterized protein n=1 Tax=Durusdinium trenchii TaxID=1381693 RepID=A0ABP0HI70_9DINO
MAKFLMLVEVLGSHRYYREVLGRRRQTGLPSISFHVVDAFYGFSYTIVAFHIAWASLEQASLLQRRWLPGGWSPIGIFLSLILRGAFLPFGMKLKAAMYFSVHRLLHVQPFYTCWHKEHHFSASQTCLTACQESGLLESGAEVQGLQTTYRTDLSQRVVQSELIDSIVQLPSSCLLHYRSCCVLWPLRCHEREFAAPKLFMRNMFAGQRPKL